MYSAIFVLMQMCCATYGPLSTMIITNASLYLAQDHPPLLLFLTIVFPLPALVCISVPFFSSCFQISLLFRLWHLVPFLCVQPYSLYASIAFYKRPVIARRKSLTALIFIACSYQPFSITSPGRLRFDDQRWKIDPWRLDQLSLSWP